MLAEGLSVSSLWIGNAMSPYEHLCLSSFVRAGYEVKVFTYDPTLVIPLGAQRCDAREVMPESSVFENQRQHGTYTAFSDIFRYRLLQLQDTTWIDTDVILVSDSLPDGAYLFGYEDPGYANCAILRAPSESPFVDYLFDTSVAADHATMNWGDIGPRLVTDAITRFNLQDLVQPSGVLYPVHYREVGMLFDPEQCEAVTERLQHASTLHLWNEIMRRGGPVKQLRPPRGSWLARAFDSYDIDFGSDFVHDVEWVLDAVDLGKLSRDAAITQRDDAIRARDAAHAARDAALTQLDTVVRERDTAIAERDAALAQSATRPGRFSWLRRDAD